MLLILLACQPADDSDTAPFVDTDEPAPGEYALSLPAAEPSDGNALADRCGWTLSAAYECYNGNPQVSWADAPAGTAAFALVLDDPDARDFEHWAVANIPGDLTGLNPGISGQDVNDGLPEGAYELVNGFGFTGYLGSCPPEAHVYRWRLWALSEALPAGIESFDELESAAEALALGTADTCHIYGPRTE